MATKSSRVLWGRHELPRITFTPDHDFCELLQVKLQVLGWSVVVRLNAFGVFRWLVGDL